MSRPLRDAGLGLPQGLRLGKYELIRPLGVGGMAQVWLAHKPIVGGHKVCALKMPADLLGTSPRLREGLLNEVRLASMLTHSNIVQVYDAGIVHGILYMELEAIDGLDLAQLLDSAAQRQLQLSIEMSVYVLRAVLEALHYAHTFAIDGKSMAILHRDLSPHNVLVSASGEVKIMDFGIGKTERDATSGQHIKGKLRYMAPEQAAGHSCAASDLFAAGAIVFEMLEGTRFRPQLGTPELLGLAMNGAAPALTRSDVPPVLRTFYEKLVARDLGARFANAAEALRHLSQWRGLDIHAQDMRSFYQRQLLRGRHSGFYARRRADPRVVLAPGRGAQGELRRAQDDADTARGRGRAGRGRGRRTGRRAGRRDVARPGDRTATGQGARRWHRAQGRRATGIHTDATRRARRRRGRAGRSRGDGRCAATGSEVAAARRCGAARAGRACARARRTRPEAQG
ncbi:MAG: serine/threonine-protein kinase [Nannocystaceae bacterium]